MAARCEAAEDPRAEFVRAVTGHWRFTDLRLDAAELERRVAPIEPFDAGAGLRALYGLYAEKFGKARFGDKSPFYLDHMPLVERLMPEAHFLHVIRDGRDVAVSIRPLWFGPNSVRKAAGWWRDGIERARSDRCRPPSLPGAALRGPRARHRGDAEASVRLHRASLRSGDARLPRARRRADPGGPAGGSAATRGELIATVEQRHAIHRLTSSPPQADRIGRWRHELRWWERRVFEARAGHLLAELGYPVG